MKEQGKLLGKKRKKIFMINKCSKNNHTKNHLIEISKLILDYIKQNNNKTGSQITEYIINILQPEKKDKLLEKNIQRRVYDSINVMNSLGFIKKNKQNIKYISIKKNNKDENDTVSYLKEININDFKNKNEKGELKAKILEYSNKKKELKLRQEILIHNYIKLKSYENSSEQIKQKNELKNNNYFFQNNLLSPKKNNIENYSNIKKEQIQIPSIKKIMDNPNEIKRKKLSQELLKQLEQNNKNQKNKINNKFLKNKKNIGNKNIGKIKRFKLKLIKFEKVKENNLNEDIVFNYLKNLKLFENELFSICNEKI